jgi:2-oxoisovalerate dehydrogenase E1 component
MITPVEQMERRVEPDEWFGLTPDDLLSMYRTMYTSRSIDDREMAMKRQQKIFFQISGAGHEAVLTAAGKATRPGYDWFFTYYRDRALCLELGVTPYEMLLQAVGAADDPASGGRQMPSHFGHIEYNIPSASSPTGTQFLQAVGCAEAGVKAARLGLEELVRFESDEVAIVCTGDGTTSEGEFWESLNTASNLQLPVVYIVEDNGYAISVPVEVNTAGASISRLVSGFPNLLIREVDGTDPIASYGVMTEAVAYCRERRGPALVHARVVRPYSHSMSDDERMYKPEEEREEEKRRDPISNFGLRLVREGIATEEELAALRQTVNDEVAEAADLAAEQPQPGPDTVYRHIYSSSVDATSDDFETEPHFEGDPKTTVDLLNACMRDELGRDPRIVVFGQDVADVSKENYLEELKGKGGVFKVTANLQRLFGAERVYNSPLAEANIVGRAVGMALRGMKPVVEIQFFDYIWPAYHQLRNELATYRWRSNGAFSCPVVVRPLERARRQRTTPDGDPLRGSGPLPRAQASLPAALRQVRVSGTGLHDPVRPGQRRSPWERPHSRHLWGARGALAEGSAPTGERGTAGRCGDHRSSHPESARHGHDLGVRAADEQGDRGLRGLQVIRLRRRDLGPGRRRSLRVAGWAGAQDRVAGHLRRLCAPAGGRHPSPGGRILKPADRASGDSPPASRSSGIWDTDS